MNEYYEGQIVQHADGGYYTEEGEPLEMPLFQLDDGTPVYESDLDEESAQKLREMQEAYQEDEEDVLFTLADGTGIRESDLDPTSVEMLTEMFRYAEMGKGGHQSVSSPNWLNKPGWESEVAGSSFKSGGQMKMSEGEMTEEQRVAYVREAIADLYNEASPGSRHQQTVGAGGTGPATATRLDPDRIGKRGFRKEWSSPNPQKHFDAGMMRNKGMARMKQAGRSRMMKRAAIGSGIGAATIGGAVGAKKLLGRDKKEESAEEEMTNNRLAEMMMEGWQETQNALAAINQRMEALETPQAEEQFQESLGMEGETGNLARQIIGQLTDNYADATELAKALNQLLEKDRQERDASAFSGIGGFGEHASFVEQARMNGHKSEADEFNELMKDAYI